MAKKSTVTHIAVFQYYDAIFQLANVSMVSGNLRSGCFCILPKKVRDRTVDKIAGWPYARFTRVNNYFQKSILLHKVFTVRGFK